MVKSPCKDCERAGCGVYHSQCEKYQKYVENNKARLKETHKESVFNYSPKRHLKTPKSLKSNRGR